MTGPTVTLSSAAWAPREGAGSAPCLPRIYRVPFLPVLPPAPPPVVVPEGIVPVELGDDPHRPRFIGRARVRPLLVEQD